MTWPGSARPIALATFTTVLGVACLGVVAQADAAVSASVVSSQLRVTSDAAADVITLRLLVSTQTIEVRRGSTLVGNSSCAARSPRSGWMPAVATTS